MTHKGIMAHYSYKKIIIILPLFLGNMPILLGDMINVSPKYVKFARPRAGANIVYLREDSFKISNWSTSAIYFINFIQINIFLKLRNKFEPDPIIDLRSVYKSYIHQSCEMIQVYIKVTIFIGMIMSTARDVRLTLPWLPFIHFKAKTNDNGVQLIN